MNEQREIVQGDLLVDGSQIAAIGPNLEQAAERVIDLHGALLIPGLIQTHIHLCQTLFRGQADDLELLDWLKQKIWPLEGGHDPESLYDSALLGIGELFLGGTTTIVDMETVHHTEHAFQAILDTGIRALSGKVMMDDPSGDVPLSLQESTQSSLQVSNDLFEKYHGQGNGRLEVAFTPRFVISCTDDLLKEVSRLARLKKAFVHTHASENRGEIEVVEKTRGMRNVVYLEKVGLTGPNLILAHCIWLDEQEKEILVQSKTRIAHCPSSNLKLASGIAAIPELLQRGAEISLGADGAPCNNNLDAFVEMRHAALIQKPLHGPTVMPARQVVEMATLAGARAIGHAHDLGPEVEGRILREVQEVADLVHSIKPRVIFVTNEVGQGIVPDNALARTYRDLAGRSNQILAHAAEAVYLVVSGYPLEIKSSGQRLLAGLQGQG